jgi:uncharacterized Zn finger protein (UPF0148 family)
MQPTVQLDEQQYRQILKRLDKIAALLEAGDDSADKCQRCGGDESELRDGERLCATCRVVVNEKAVPV